MQSIAQLIAYMDIQMSFVNSETVRKAYLGKHAQDLILKSSDQVLDVYKARGIVIPVVVSSTLQFLNRDSGASLSDIARALELPHQLVAQRTEKLLKLGLVTKQLDPADKRRSEFHLTKTGQNQAHLLKQCMADMALVYADIYDEIDCDLAQALLDAITALERKPLLSRFEDKFSNIKEIG